ncbi:hypothetical protein BDW22DRAFT_1357213 [Trametopsis cervina]|nr:hypothetical protein BDW22DRAFT_1357213 [Trametopsis cervina]
MVESASLHPNTKRTFVYYCSGHGYGHATRVSAFTTHLLSLRPQPFVYIVSSAPQHVFSGSLALGAFYRQASIDPVIVQPLAYRVDRAESVKVLRHFLQRKPALVEVESRWLRLVKADCVLSDAAFLGCVAANAVGIPSVLITNFTFDAVYSYLSTPFVDDNDAGQADSSHLTSGATVLPPDVPIPSAEIAPLVDEIWSGYRCADLLLRLPGAIPIPSFFEVPALPSPEWVNIHLRTFTPEIVSHLLETPSQHELLPHIPFPQQYPAKTDKRSVISAPLLVRPPSTSIYTPEGRHRLLETIGVSEQVRHSDATKILLVSFGGQIFHKPSSRSRTHSRSNSHSASGAVTPDLSILAPSKIMNALDSGHESALSELKHNAAEPSGGSEPSLEVLSDALQRGLVTPRKSDQSRVVSQGIRAQPLLMVPGAPPANIPSSPVASSIPTFNTIVIPPTPQIEQENVFSSQSLDSVEEASLLPDDSWIAIVCGVPKDWAHEDGDELPEGFFVAPKDVYMPDLTALADVLLGKLGYGTVSECVDACTPFVYVPRPLFIEEHGLRLFLEKEGVGVELSRDAYEGGDWAVAVQEAYEKGKERKARKRLEGDTGRSAADGVNLALQLLKWLDHWKQ